MTSLKHQFDAIAPMVSIYDMVHEHGGQCMPYFAKFSVPLQNETEIFSIETLDFLKQIIFSQVI